MATMRGVREMKGGDGGLYRSAKPASGLGVELGFNRLTILRQRPSNSALSSMQARQRAPHNTPIASAIHLAFPPHRLSIGLSAPRISPPGGAQQQKPPQSFDAAARVSSAASSHGTHPDPDRRRCSKQIGSENPRRIISTRYWCQSLNSDHVLASDGRTIFLVEVL